MSKKDNFKTALSELVNGKVRNETKAEDRSGRAAAVKQPETRTETQLLAGSGTGNKPKQLSVISKDMVIDGNITTSTDVRIDGKVKGTVRSEAAIQCGGTIEGDVFCDHISMVGCRIQGDVNARTKVLLDANSVVIGDIAACDLEVKGKMQGNIKAAGMAEICESAVLMGNISAERIALKEGASLRGVVEMVSGHVSEDSFAPKMSQSEKK